MPVLLAIAGLVAGGLVYLASRPPSPGTQPVPAPASPWGGSSPLPSNVAQNAPPGTTAAPAGSDAFGTAVADVKLGVAAVGAASTAAGLASSAASALGLTTVSVSAEAGATAAAAGGGGAAAAGGGGGAAAAAGTGAGVAAAGAGIAVGAVAVLGLTAYSMITAKPKAQAIWEAEQDATYGMGLWIGQSITVPSPYTGTYTIHGTAAPGSTVQEVSAIAEAGGGGHQSL